MKRRHPGDGGSAAEAAEASAVSGQASALHDLQQLLAHLPVAVYVCEAPSGLIRLYNRRAVELWGREPTRDSTDERFCGSLRLFTPDGRPLPHADTPMAEVLRHGGVRDEEVVIERPDGSTVTVRVNISALRDTTGRIIGAVNAFQDVTERKRAEADSARLAAIVSSADDAIVSKTLDGIVTSWNRGAEAMFGYAASEAVGQPITIIVPADLRDEEAEILRRLARGEAVEGFETQRVGKDGRRFPVSVTVSPVKDAHGRTIGASKIARDISARHRAEEGLKASLRTLEVLYRLADQIGRAQGRVDVCQAAVDAIMGVGADRASVLVFDDGGVMRFVAWRGLSAGYRAAVDGHSPWLPGATAPSSILVEDILTDPTVDAFRDVIASEGVRALGFFPLVYQRRLLGKFMIYYDAPHRFSAEELRLAATIAHHVAFGLARARAERDIESLLDRERSARREADAARADAERASRAKDEFLAMLAHELRNPLSVIVNATAVLDGSATRLPELVRAGKAIRRQAEHLARLLDDLLDVARIASGRIELDREHVDLRGAAELAVETQQHRLDGKRQRVHLSLPEAPVTVIGDAVRLQQVLGNLVNNASKYTPAGGSIWVTVGRDDGEAVLRVRDDGTGIPSDKLESIFDLFIQGNPTLARTEGGLGIGLTLVRRVVELHGGRVRATSAGPARGAEFIVHLPLAGAAPSPPLQQPARARGTPRRVLVIEDNDDGREMLLIPLRRYGHEVLEAATGREGIEAVERHAPNIVLVDIGLPDLDGYEVGRRLRQKYGNGLRLVALTGYGQPQDRARSEAAGFEAHLVKPVDPLKLVEFLQQLT